MNGLIDEELELNIKDYDRINMEFVTYEQNEFDFDRK